MGRYANEPDNIPKSAKARGSNLRVHFKVTMRDLLRDKACFIIKQLTLGMQYSKRLTVSYIEEEK